ncbi:tapasin-related protein-like [Alosa sapidissima]|uniref:tapasin-related protein-like n=1 Tax=Alosa sapidissima TaxID=34773 RepID=UPI001C08A15B|nr:tapasin-related protein-like [Alosa sapidissima]
MIVMFNVLFSVLFTAIVSQSIHEARWLPCHFIDEYAEIFEKQGKTKFRDARLQFGQPGDSPVHSELITFLVTASKVDMRRYIKGGLDTLQCEVRRHYSGGTPVRWPKLGAQEHDNWFTCTLHHTEGLFVITSVLRQSSNVRNVMQPGLQHWIQQWVPVADKDIISTTAVMLMFTNTPTVVVGLMKEQTLNCEFAVDHKAAHLTVEWHLQRKGNRSKLFSYSSHTGQSEGSGVSVKAIAKGDASLKIPFTNITSEGTYVCSVHVPPISGSHYIQLNIKELPRLSLNVNSQVSLSVGELLRVDCEATNYYPHDVHMEWLKESLTPGASRMPEVLNNTTFSSHHRKQNYTYSHIVSYLLKPTLQDSGYRYSCRLSHHALQMHIQKSFTLSVTDKDSYLWYIPPILTILGILGFLLIRRRAVPKGPKGVYGRA